MCGAGIEQHYVLMMEEEKNEELIDETFVQNSSFVSFSFSTFVIKVPYFNS